MRGIPALTPVRASRAGLWASIIGLSLALSSAQSFAQEDEDYGGGGYESDEPAFEVNVMMKMQGGVFVPLMSEKFTEQKNEAYAPYPSIPVLDKTKPCDPVMVQTNGCQPINHGQPAGSPSIMRATFQLEAQWNIDEKVGLHSIVRAVRSMRLPADEMGRPPNPALDPNLQSFNFSDVIGATGGWIASLMFFLFALASVTPSCFCAFIAGNSFSTMIPGVPRMTSTMIGVTISIILAFMNILPIPALDGGHVVFLLYEMVTGRPPHQRVLEVAQMIGMVLLLGLLLYANGNDLVRAIVD